MALWWGSVARRVPVHTRQTRAVGAALRRRRAPGRHEPKVVTHKSFCNCAEVGSMCGCGCGVEKETVAAGVEKRDETRIAGFRNCITAVCGEWEAPARGGVSLSWAVWRHSEVETKV